ncbi:MAG: peroxiredoxin [Acidobacteria bacterium]|nr:peroxiredoxin [Acidobacteriota bacterium]
MLSTNFGLGAQAPDFSLDGVLDGNVRHFSIAEFKRKWLILFFYPADFTFVCPTEIRGFQRRIDEFTRAGCRIVGIGVDDVASHREWAQELGGVSFPLLSDPRREVCRAYGVLNEADGRAFRATVIVSPDGVVSYMVVSPMNVGRSVDETLRVVSALQTGRLCPADWRPGDATLDPELHY